MCLTTDLALTREWRERMLASGGVATVYKRMFCPGDELVTWGGYVWTPGWNEARGELPHRIVDGTQIGRGVFHVWLLASLVEETPLGVPLLGRLEDFVAAGNGVQGVFRRLHLDPIDHKRALKRAKRLRADESKRLRKLVAPPKPWRKWLGKLLGGGTTDSHRGEQCQAPRPNEHWSKRFARYHESRARTTWVRRALVDVNPAPGEEPVVWLQYDGARRNGQRRVVRHSIVEHERSWARRIPDPAA